ncbi:hypothetical protein DPMN_117656 [Dreissena polymorpha]|uniref:Uncharacterized protein n=1 Tax=Dreissena polymorpha TaxID=45954 RepID=A0A9D4GFX9_DREPO|nr:hypothetical protein DPMN_117656 [Dreissena polymorpha]
MFDSKYRKIEKKSMTVPSEILAFKMLRKANISKDERLLVLTGMNYDNKKTLYEVAKKSLKKLKGGEGASSSQQDSFKLEPAFLAANEEAFIAAGYSRIRSGYRGNYSNNRGGSWKQEKGWRPNMRDNQRGEFSTDSCKNGYTKNINPTGQDGKPLTGKSCGSF